MTVFSDTHGGQIFPLPIPVRRGLPLDLPTSCVMSLTPRDSGATFSALAVAAFPAATKGHDAHPSPS
jgi:hypothetical protein